MPGRSMSQYVAIVAIAVIGRVMNASARANSHRGSAKCVNAHAQTVKIGKCVR